MEHSESVKSIAAALVAVQSKLKPLKRNADNPFFKSNYTDLAAMAEALYPALTAEGIAVVQGGNGQALDTLLLHVSGEWVSSSLPMPVESNPQKLGSVITYFRRYALAAIVGAASEGEDDDGNAASGKNPQAHPPAPSPANRPSPQGEARPNPTPTQPAPAARATGAGPASPGDALEVTDLAESEGTSAKGSWRRFTATFNNGTRASTFDTKHGAMLKVAHEKGEPVIVTFQKSGNFTNIVNVEEFPF